MELVGFVDAVQIAQFLRFGFASQEPPPGFREMCGSMCGEVYFVHLESG